MNYKREFFRVLSKERVELEDPRSFLYDLLTISAKDIVGKETEGACASFGDGITEPVAGKKYVITVGDPFKFKAKFLGSVEMDYSDFESVDDCIRYSGLYLVFEQDGMLVFTCRWATQIMRKTFFGL